jgi:two-component system LytT family sensor kinase
MINLFSMKGIFNTRQGTIILHTIIWSLLLLFPYFFATTKTGYRVDGIPVSFITITSLINIALFYIHAYFIYPSFFNRRQWWLYLLTSAVLIVGSLRLKGLLLSWYPTIDVSTYRFIFPSSIVLFIFSFIYRVVIDKERVVREMKERQATQALTELKFLRSQVSPHFLFNVLTNLVSLARKKSDKLEPALIKLSELLRYMLYDTQGKKVTLQTEIEYLDNYLDLQRLRFGDDVDIDSQIEAEEEVLSYAIEPMLLIPFVENAFKHGVGYSGRPGITLRLSVASGILTFEVKNKFEAEPENTKDESSGIGLGNVISRLNLLYRNKYTLVIDDANSLFHIVLTLKLL